MQGEGKVVLDYVAGPDVVMGVLVEGVGGSESHPDVTVESEIEVMQWRKGSQAKECGLP